jgi:hypothetical protein
MNSMYYIVINTHTNNQIVFSYWIKIVCYSKWLAADKTDTFQLKYCSWAQFFNFVYKYISDISSSIYKIKTILTIIYSPT